MHAPIAAGFAAIFAVLTSATAMATEGPGFQTAREERQLRTASVHGVCRRRDARRSRLRGGRQRRLPAIVPLHQRRQRRAAEDRDDRARDPIERRAARRKDCHDRAGLAGRRWPCLPRRLHAAVHLHARHGPKPQDPTVRICDVPPQLIACWRYQGCWTVANYRENETLLRERIKARSLAVRGDPGPRPLQPSVHSLVPAPQRSSDSGCAARQTLTSPRCLDGGDVDLRHRHHRLEGTLRLTAASRHRVGERARRDLPGEAPTILAPAARLSLPPLPTIAFQ